MPVLPADNSEALGTQILGDIVICPEKLSQEASEQGKSVQDHWAHLVVHSVLHLTGLDHNSEIAAETMESLEIQILSGLGIDNPYQSASAN